MTIEYSLLFPGLSATRWGHSILLGEDPAEVIGVTESRSKGNFSNGLERGTEQCLSLFQAETADELRRGLSGEGCQFAVQLHAADAEGSVEVFNVVCFVVVVALVRTSGKNIPPVAPMVGLLVLTSLSPPHSTSVTSPFSVLVLPSIHCSSAAHT